jgi:peptidoglycan/xylan/chitin deacetylase (PgdA/CDA1 family)
LRQCSVKDWRSFGIKGEHRRSSAAEMGFVMKVSRICMATLLFAAGLIAPAQAQKAGVPSLPAEPSVTGSVSARASAAQPACANPTGLGVARTVEVDTTGGPGFGFEHFKMHDFLRPSEVVLTLDDGPWPGNTPAVLRALAAHCVKATFFSIGKHALWHPEILKQVAEQGHTIGTHTWSHANLAKKSAAEAKDEIEKGLSAVRLALGAAPAPFFRFPALAHPTEMVTYLGERNIGIFSADMDSFDFKLKKPAQVIGSVMDKLKKHGKGIVLMHDFQRVTAEAMPELLNQLQAGGYKIVHLKPKDPSQTLAEYDALILKEQKLPTVSARPTASVVRTIGE